MRFTAFVSLLLVANAAPAQEQEAHVWFDEELGFKTRATA